MKLRFVGIAMVGALCISFSSLALADDECVLQGTAVPISQIQKSIQDLGYTMTKKIKLDDCIYKAKVTDKAGKKSKLIFDPLNGKLIGKKSD